MEGMDIELWSWGLNKRCEENTGGKTKRGEHIKGICKSCQTRQRRQLSEAARRENGHASKEKQQSAKWRTLCNTCWCESHVFGFSLGSGSRHVVADCYWGPLMRITGLGLRKSQPAVTRASACRAPHRRLKTSSPLFVRSPGRTEEEVQSIFSLKYI